MSSNSLIYAHYKGLRYVTVKGFFPNFIKVQPSPDGLAQAFIIGADFIGTDYVAMILGDNIFAGHGLKKRLLRAANKQEGASTRSLPDIRSSGADGTPWSAQNWWRPLW